MPYVLLGGMGGLIYYWKIKGKASQQTEVPQDSL
jgi:hypothetical protein